ncbi:hypothetical protein AAFC00_006651 [Neodothiora populina]|uniref:RINT-1 family protein n=1 Tax=Neodothiora populina TaxID=2781224 RepID=A0ABR3PAP9_9PEZI
MAVGAQDARIVDFLDDKLQSLADFDTLDSLLDNLKTQQDLLKQQLSDARKDHDTAQQACQQHAASVKAKAAAFEQEQGEIDRRLMIVTQSETSEEAIQRFQSSTDRLHRLDVASGYAEMLKEVDVLSQQCTAQLGKDDVAALESYKRLQGLSRSLNPLQEAAEGAAPHLLHHVASSVAALRDSIRSSLTSNLDKTLAKMAWPRSDIVVPPDLQQEWRTNIERLLDLQKSELLAGDVVNKTKASKDEPSVLLPFSIMLKPLELRFLYHFSGDRPTNRLDKPEYFLSHILDLLNTYAAFFQSNMQRLLLSNFRDSDLAFVPAYIDTTSAFITALLPMAERKLWSILPQVASQPQLLSNLIHEVMSFDKTIEEEWSYTPLSPSMPWRGLAYFILEKQSYFPQWLAAEREFALARYEAIVSDRASGELDFDSVSATSTKPSRAAVRVNDLLDTITERYRTLSSFSQKLRFLIDIQIAIFDRFHQRLHEGLEAYLTRTSAVARTVHGVTRDDQAELAGVKGLDRLCRVFGSAEYLEKALREWSDDVFFLEIWEELQYRATSKTPIKGDLRMSDIASKTSATIATNGAADHEELQGALFDETAASYQKLRIRSQGIIVDTITYNIRDALRSYTRINPWASLSSTNSASSEAALTAELDAPLRLLEEYFSFLSRALGKAPLKRIGRLVAHAVQSTLWDSLLMRHSFSTAGAQQFVVDVNGIWSIFDRYIDLGSGAAGMRKLSEALSLLSLPVKGEIAAVNDNQDTRLDYGEEMDAKKIWGLFEVERRVFIDNEAARDVLEEMGLELLSEGDARSILEKRVELSS